VITKGSIRVEDHLTAGRGPGEGAVVIFAGAVRADEKDGKRVTHIHYDCYEEMARGKMAEVVESVRSESGVSEIRAVHRVGDVPVGDIALLVVVTAGHRAEAYEANRRVVEEIKRTVPIWKKEIYDDKSGEWR
jgi:molybdopterin synthase catalytic subunit